MEWRDVTEEFTPEQRHYKNLYLEKCLVFNNEVEVSLFTPEEPGTDYEIYFSFGIFYGIVYADEGSVESKFEEIRKELEEERRGHDAPRGEFINTFCRKHRVALPSDIFFDADGLFD